MSFVNLVASIALGMAAANLHMLVKMEKRLRKCEILCDERLRDALRRVVSDMVNGKPANPDSTQTGPEQYHDGTSTGP